MNKGFIFFMKDLNTIYRRFPALYENDFSHEGFEWIDANDSENSVLGFMRYDKQRKQKVLAIANLTPVPRYNYRIGVSDDVRWTEIFNSDAPQYGGSGMGNMGSVECHPVPYHEKDQSINVVLPPLSIVMFSQEM
jgi:1,4-alpha-glucan branching enzyme